MALRLVQVFDVTATTDGDGYFTFNFERNITQVVASANSAKVVAATADVVGNKEVKVRVWNIELGKVVPAKHLQCKVTLAGFYQ